VDEGDDRLSLPRPKWEANEIAILGGAEDDLTIASGFLTAAEILTRHWIDQGPNDALPIPILYNYRHGIELTMKWLIRLTARCLKRHGYTEAALSTEALDQKLRTHSIKDLADLLDRYMGLLQVDPPYNRIDSESRQLLDWLDSQDETGETWRYAVVGRGPNKRAARPEQVNINFFELVNELHNIANLLYSGYTTFLAEYEEFQIDYYDDLGSQGP